MNGYILPIMLTVTSGFVFLQNKKPIEKRALAFDDPWGTIIYITTGTAGIYLFWQIGIKEMIIGWFLSLFVAKIISEIFEKTFNK
jgi:amino acid transporter